MAKPAARTRAFARHDPRQARVRLMLAVAVGALTALAIPSRYGSALRALAGWDCAALVIGLLSWALILRATPEETRRRAAADDPGRRFVWASVIVTSGVSLFATTVILRQARSPGVRDLFVALGIFAVVSAWLLTHTAYTLRYAHLYYRDHSDGIGGLTFPGDGPPAYIEFAYFAFTVGMCFQVSDVTIVRRQIRRAVLGHSLLSFAYNTAILATTINLVVGALG